MSNKVQIEKAAELTLNSLDNLQPVEANAFLHAKILNRMQQGRQQTNPVKHNRLMLRLSLALGLLMCINGLSYYVLTRQQSTGSSKAKTGSAAFAEDYQLNTSSYSY